MTEGEPQTSTGSEELPERLRPSLEHLASKLLGGRAEAESAESETLRGASRALLELGELRTPSSVGLGIFDPQTARAPWPSPLTAIAIVTDDHPFIVGSIAAELGRRGLRIETELRCRPLVRRDEEGRLVEILEAEEPEPATAEPAGMSQLLESWLLLEVDGLFGEEARHELTEVLVEVLAEARIVVEDWRAMRSRLEAVGRALETAAASKGPEARETEEILAFTYWLLADHYTFLAFRLEPAAEGTEAGLGLWRAGDGEPARQGPPPASGVEVRKSRRLSRVHRPVPMDLIDFWVPQPEGGLRRFRFAGLFTSRAYMQPANAIPILRRRIEGVLMRAGLAPDSYDGRRLRHVLESYPRDELFQLGEEQLLQNALRLLDLELRPRTMLLVHYAPEPRRFHCLSFLPHGAEALVPRITAMLESALGGSVLLTSLSTLDSPPLTRLQILLQARHDGVEPPGPDALAALETRLAEAVTPFPERLRPQLLASPGGRRGLHLWHRYRAAFPATYVEQEGLGEVAADVEILEATAADGRLGLRLRALEETRRFRLRTFEAEGFTLLAENLRTLDHLGFDVVAERSHRVRPEDPAQELELSVFELEAQTTPWGNEPRELCRRLEEAYRGVREQSLEDDVFNRLVLAAGLDAREVTLLRGYARYLKQAGALFSLTYMARALERNPRVTRDLVQLFACLFDPEQEGREPAELLGHLRQRLDAVESLDEDRILRRFANLVQSTLRTNYYQLAEDGGAKPYLALKLDPSRIVDLPSPRPQSEIFVTSPSIEGVHMRSSLVARGGIRWSDRLEDFRIEILGLLKAQTLKNTTIVASGAKGGFVIRRPPAARGREAWQKAGIAAYRTLLHGLLDVVDNREGDRILPAPRTRRRDGDDSYFVVASDKGTATFSDIANQIARERGFSLGDAFASGGSAGYDHKKMGITARGAWESVKRHFRELGRDIQREPLTVVGIGDMSGDVFGNGMLLSRQIRLVAAFNHRHIFLDPDPDPETSWHERDRLFSLPRSAWTDYDQALISKGGGVFDRRDKRIQISPEVCERFGVNRIGSTPDELILAILRAPVDLLWMGGIGTYVKASHETHAMVGDRANDRLRIDALELRVAVVGEGANLGLTQRARVEYALAGGHLNTDALDNGGGVQCSDLEVNMKIVLEAARQTGELGAGERDPLLSAMSEEVALRVLALAYEYSQAVSLAEVRAAALLEEHERWICELERRGLLDRRLEGLPDDAELERRHRVWRGLTRPEIAVLLAYAKLELFEALLRSSWVRAPGLLPELLAYFPATLAERFPRQVAEHRLRAEIVASQLTRWSIHRLGATALLGLRERAEAPAEAAVAAALLAREALDAETLWHQVDTLDNQVPTTLQGMLHWEIAENLLTLAGSLLAQRSRIAALPAAKSRLAAWVRSAQTAEHDPDPEAQRRAAGFERLRTPAELARRVAALPARREALEASLTADLVVPAEAADPYLLDLGLGLLQTSTEEPGV